MGAYARAGTRLWESGGRLLLIEALLLLLLLLPAYFMISGVTSLLLMLVGEEMIGVVVVSAISALFTLAYSFFVSVPLLMGLFRLSHCLALGAEVSLSCLFYAFSARSRYRECLLAGRAVFVGGAALYLFITLAYLVLCVFLPIGDLGTSLFLPIAAAFVLLGYLFLPTCFVALRRALGREDSARAGLSLRLSFLPWILLGLATFGILLLLDVLPRLLIAAAAPLDVCDIKEDGTSPSFSDK